MTTMTNDTSPESTAIKTPIIGELRLLAWTGTTWHDFGMNMEVVMDALRAQHAAIDSLFAKNIMADKTRTYLP